MGKENENKALSRVAFLAEQYNVLDAKEFDIQWETVKDNPLDNLVSYGDGQVPLAIISQIVKKESQYEGAAVTSYKTVIKIHEDVFVNMVQADPTDNKIYLQWMLTVFTRQIKDEDYQAAIRFAIEDLTLANEYLKLFDANKRKQLFKTLCRANSELLKISDPTNINQYKNLSQVFDVVDPFIERDPSTLELALKRFTELGQALMPVRDRNFTLYIPLTVAASEVFGSFTRWCTTSKGNGMHKHYTNMKTPDGKDSKLYIVIDNAYFLGESDNLWQLHFESNQIMDRADRRDDNFYENVIEKSEVISQFFYNELIGFARMEQTNKPGVGKVDKINNKYLKQLIKFGHPEAMFDVLSENSPSITFADELIPKVPDLSRFNSVGLIYIANSKVKELHQSIGKLKSLEQLVISHNQIEVLPNYIGECTNLVFMNLVGNKIKFIPNDISKLDPANGGRLVKMSVKSEDVGDDNFNKLKQLLPNVEIGFTL